MTCAIQQPDEADSEIVKYRAWQFFEALKVYLHEPRWTYFVNVSYIAGPYIFVR